MNTIFEDVRDWWEREHHHPGTAAAHAAATATIRTTTGGPVSQLSADLHNLAAKVEPFDDAALHAAAAIFANPETAVVASDLAVLAGMPHIPPGYITGTANSLKVLLAAFSQQPAEPVGPVTGGQAH